MQEFNRDLSLSVLSTFSKIFQEELRQKDKSADASTESDVFGGKQPGEKCDVMVVLF